MQMLKELGSLTWHTVSNLLAGANQPQERYQAEIQTLRGRYQDQIDALKDEKGRLKTQLADAQAQNRILQSRLETTFVNPWSLSDFLQKHASVSGNWDRLHDRLTHCVNETIPPLSWDTMINTTAVAKRREAIPDYTEVHAAALASGATVNFLLHRASRILDLTSSNNESQAPGSGTAVLRTPRRAEKTITRQKTPTPKTAKSHKIQRRPSDYKPGRYKVRRAGEPPSVPKNVALSSENAFVLTTVKRYWAALTITHLWTASRTTTNFTASSVSLSSSSCWLA
ncbi:unnamed protein product [Phytophthora fragariaefolia]|uniref:Unnamed protein product n=1 Tax=Phytophthora fragariaefolia TaxID=1490495 RepID=A0A9W6Y9J6_9STRA|nr:unnamed protein product [Phytophthora fragariaefolia]